MPGHDHAFEEFEVENEFKNDHAFEEFEVKNKFKDDHAFEEFEDEKNSSRSGKSQPRLRRVRSML